MTKHECVHLDHVLQMYHVGYHKGHRPSSIREPPVESATSITVQQLTPPGRARMRGQKAGAGGNPAEARRLRTWRRRVAVM